MLPWLLACTTPAPKVAETTPQQQVDSSTDSGTAVPWLSISDPASSDADGDGLWSAGESLTLQVVLHNNWSEDYLWYPGVLVSSPDEMVQIPEPGGDWRYALLANTEDTMNILVTADASVKSGTILHFQLEVTSLGCVNEQLHCVDPGALGYERPVD